MSCLDCGHDLMEHGPSGCTHGYHIEPREDLARGYEVCSCRRGRHDPLPDHDVDALTEERSDG